MDTRLSSPIASLQCSDARVERLDFKLTGWPVPDLARDYGVREIDVWTGLISFIQWKATILSPANLMVLDADTVAMGAVGVDPEASMTDLMATVHSSLSPVDQVDDEILRQYGCDVAVEWNPSDAYDVPAAPLVAAVRIDPTTGDATVSYFWDPAKHDRAYAEIWHGHLTTVLGSLAGNPRQALKDLDIVTDRDREIIGEANSTTHPITDCRYVYDLLDRATTLYADKTAMVSTEGSLTYAELGQRVDALAEYLRGKGIGRGDAVALLADRGLLLVTAMFAVMKAGAAVVPLSRLYPRSRTEAILADAGAQLVLVTNPAYRDLLPATANLLDLTDPGIPAVPTAPVAPVNEPDDLCSILYTSGTSGIPKGVMVRHVTIVNAAETCRTEWRFGSADAEPQFAPATFIAAVNEMAFAVAAGGTQYLPGDALIQDPRAFTMYSIEHQMTHIVTTPDYAQYLGPIPTVRTVVTLGAQCSPDVSEHLIGYDHINVYGLTEAGLALYWPREKGQPIPANLPIGRPIWNTHAYILRDGAECGLYMPGELCLTGACVSAGYRNLPDLTAEHFVPNPFGEGLMFRTGDLVQWNADGCIEYIGRGDEQVQIHGQRVELGEVEHALMAFPGITACCAVASTDSGGDPSIAAFIVADLPLDCKGLRDRLTTTMVSYMVPARIVQIDEMPRTPNGKYDKRSLLKRLETIPLAEPSPFGSNGLEAVIRDTIEEVLPGSTVAPDDSFFSLGGDSLTGVRFVNELEARTGIRVPLVTLFEHPTPRELTNALHAMMEEQFGALKGQHIPSVGGAGVYPASSPQRRVYVVDQLDQEGLAYHIPVVVRFEDRVDPAWLDEVFQKLVDRHEVLRTSFETDADGNVVQRVHEHVDAHVDHINVDDVSDQTANAILAEFVRPFDLGQAPLVRLMLAQGPGEESLLVFDAHHSVLDGSSMTLVVEEFAALYRGEDLPPTGPEYKDYSAWLSAQDTAPARQYWADVFADPPTQLDLPTDYPRPALQNFAGATLTRTIPAEVRARVEDLARRAGATEAMVVMAAWGAVLGRYGRTDDLVIGMPVSGRVHPDTEHMLGMFVNTVPLRVRPRADAPFEQYLTEVRDTMVKSLTYQSYPLEDILDQVDVPRDLSRNPLFDTALVFQNFAPADLDLTGLAARRVPVDTVAANLDVSVYVTPTPEGYQVVMEYRTDLFTPDTIEYLFRHLETLLDHVVSTPGIRVGDAPLIDQGEQDFLSQLNGWTSPVRDVTVVDLFDEQVAAHMDAVAVVWRDRVWTYGELDIRARQIASRLHTAGVALGQFVMLYVDRSPEMVAAMLGTLKAGAAYVPVSMDTPAPRIATIVDSCHPAAVVVAGTPVPVEVSCPVVDLADLGENPDWVPGPSSLDDPAYCIFTSGSTGVPKGVVITHRSLTAFAQDPTLYDLLHGVDRPRLVATADYSFDMSVTEWYPGLCRGVPVAVAAENECVDQHEFSHLVKSCGGTIIQATPTRLRMLTADPGDREYLGGVRLFLIGGEVVPADLLQMLTQYTSAAVQIMYGPTEATVWSATGAWTPGEQVSLGRPMANEQIYVTDGIGNLCGIGIPGEICVAGRGLARGYLGDEDLTARKFTPNPFGEGRLYHTGDVGMWDPDGKLRFLGRVDTQVKVHGVRIETGEVEHVIRDYPGITDAAVVARPDHTGDLALCAYVTGDETVDLDGLREYAVGRLPRSMVPAYWTQMDALPQNRSGKVDAAALPDPDIHHAAYVEPSTPLEQMVADAVMDVLGLDRVGARDDFFALGGDSLKAMQLANRIEEHTGSRIGLRDVFQNPCADQLAGILTGRSGDFTPIVSAGEAGVYPASSPQRRLFVLDQLDSEGLAYQAPGMIRITPQLDPQILQRVFQELVDRHEVLRTSFTAGPDGEVLQVVHEHVDAAVEVVDADDVSDEAATGILDGFVAPFDLGEAPLMRVMLAQGPDNSSLLVFDAHHIILDGTSMTLLINEFSELYSAVSSGQDSVPVPPELVAFKDYTAWFAAQDMDAAARYWSDEFAEPPAQLDLPTDHPRPPVQTFTGATLIRTIPASIRERVEQLAHQSGTTEAMVLMAAWGAVLARYGRTDDLVIGMPVSGRIHPDTETMLGMFVNTIPIRLHPRHDQAFTDYLGQARDTIVAGLTYQAYPLEDILEHVTLPRDLSRNPLFDTVLAYQNYAPADLSLTGLEAQAGTVDASHRGARFDISVSITPATQSGYQVELEYRTDLFTEDTIDYLFRHLETFLGHALDSPETALDGIGMIDAAEMSVLNHINSTATPLPDQRTIPDLFAHIVAAQPDKTALVGDGQEWTYRELDERARRIAAKLRDLGVRPDTLVGLYIGRGPILIQAILGTILSGGAYLGLDPAWPQARLEFVIGNAHPAVILTTGATPPVTGIPTLNLGDPDLYAGPAPTVDVLNKPDDLAYCIYTSGSTGEPKGVLVEHLGVVNLVNVATQYGITADDRILQYASPAFDASVAEWAHALLVGGTLIVPTETQASDSAWLNARLAGDVTVMTAPPAIIPHLDLAQLPRLISAGSQAQPVPGFTGAFVNGYGPTETTVCSALWTRKNPDDPWPDPIPIGRPRANLAAYLLDDDGNLCGMGVPGELCVAGIGLARGYLGDEDLTARKFTPNPFGEGRLYHTGDVAKWGPDGYLCFLGRVDAQVKIHGIRVEPGEIEHAIRDYPGITGTVVIGRPDNTGDLVLCAYVTGDESMDLDGLREYAAEHLPRSMVPSYWTVMDKLPVNRSGKVDTTALPDPDIHHAAYVEPSTPLEQVVADAMRSVLGLERVGAHDDFFALGGDSLKAMQLANRIEESAGSRIGLRDVFQNPCVDQLAGILTGHGEDFEPIVSVGGAGVYPASSPQRRLYILDQLDPEGLVYHLPAVVRVDSPIDPAVLQRVFQELVDRHEVLRTSFTTGADGKILQVVHEHVDATVEAAQVADTGDEAAAGILAGFVRPFDLSQAPLVRVGLAQGPDNQSLLVFDAHHIIIDGTSMTLLVNEFSRLYRGETLPPTGVEYKDYATWFAAQDMDPAAQYWTDEFAEPPAQLDLPTDFPRPALQTFAGATLTRAIPASIRQRVEELARRTGVTEAMIFTAAWGAVLARYGRTDDLVVGMPVSGRIHPDTETMLGMFVNTIPIRLHPRTDQAFTGYLDSVRDTMIAGLSHQGYPFEDILEHITLPRDLSRNPLFDTALVYQNFAPAALDLGGSDQASGRMTDLGSRFDLSVTVTPLPDSGYQVDLEYRTDLFTEETVDYFFRHLATFLDHATDNPATPVGGITMIDAAEMSVLDALNNTASPVRDVTVVDLFGEQVTTQPDAMAVVCDKQEWTYRDLDTQARRIAARLHGLGVAPGQFVALFVSRSREMVAAILGVLKTGAAYVPLNTDLPAARIHTMLSACHPAAILTYGTTLPESVHVDCPVIDLASPLPDGDLPDHHASLDDPAYCLFTSGSTGVPKGVVITHRSLAAYAQEPHFQAFYHSCDHPRFVATADYSFDISGTEIFAGMCQGMPVLIATDTQCVDQHEFAQLVMSGGGTIVQTTPTRLRMLTADPTDRDYLAHVQLFLLGGEPVPQDLLDLLISYTPATILNGYGPTETTVYSTMGPWTPGQQITIGQPLANEQAHLRDASGNLCGIGIPGELCLAGIGLARGYLGDEDLTAAKFVPNPFGEGRLYRTGDLTLWTPDGNLRFLGRIDTQVKVHGVRIETEEVEHAIRECPGITDTVVVARPDHSGDLTLCAYYTTDPHTSVDLNGLRSFVGQRLPRTMIPSYWTHMDALPINRSGKTDKAALPDPEVHFADYAAPSTPTQCLVARIMSDGLGVDQVGLHDDFFALGGDSLKALQLVNQLQKHTGAHLRLQDVFQNPTLDALADAVDARSGDFTPIVSAGGAGEYPASSPQRRLYILDQLDSQRLAYQAPGMIRITPQLDPQILQRVFQQLVDRHEVLRTSFTTGADGQVLQVVHDHVDAVAEVVQVEDTGDEAARRILAGFVRPFDLGEAPLMRVMLAQGPNNDSLLVLDAHHIVLDGTSMTLLVNEFSRLYRGETLPPVRVEYKDYTAWLDAQDMHAASEYWVGQFAEPPAQLDLPTDFPRPALQTFAGATLIRTIPASIRRRVEQLARRSGTTEAMVLMAAWGAVLARYGRTDDLTVGMPVSGRVHPDTETMLGMFVNTIPIRLHPRTGQTFTDYLDQVRDTIVTGLTYQAYPLEDILEHVTLPRDLSRNPLFDTVLTYQNYAPADLSLKRPGTQVGVVDAATHQSARFDISISITPATDAYDVELEYRTDLFAESTMDYLFRHLETFLGHALDEPETALGRITMIDEEEHHVLDQINDTAAPLPDQRTIPELFAHIVASQPDKTALVGDGQEWTYRELDERVRRIAARLREMGIQPNTLVGLHIDRGPILIQAILGTLLSGGAYLGLDPAWPEARLDYVIGNARPAVILTSGTPLPFTTGIPVLNLDDPGLAAGPAPVLEPVNKPDDLAYCIYTSGSTGEPKGVLVEHLGVVNLVNVATQYGITSDDRILQYASPAFDASVAEWAHALLVGGTLIVPTETQASDTAWLNARLAGDVTVMTAPPAIIPHLDLARLPRLISAGSQAQPVPGFTGAFVNGYGPTETTVCSALWTRKNPDDPWPDPIPIGRPRANLDAYLLDGDGNLCGIGVPGELCVSGVGLARGYLRDPDLTARKFTPNPFSQGQEPAGFDRLYHTGDVAMWQADGNLRFLGRVDAQVKIHGVRVEPGEIEHAIRDYPGITGAVVIGRRGRGDEMELCAYYVADNLVDANRLRTFVAERLPRSMVPSYWTLMDALPQNRSGKIDTAALPDPDIHHAAYVELSTPVEQVVADAMRDVLGLERVGAHDDFFALGGDSLKAMQLVNQLEKHTGSRIGLRDVFQNPCVDQLAGILTGNSEDFTPIPSIGGPGMYPASSPQRRLYVLDQLDPEGLVYHLPAVVRVDTPIDPHLLLRVFQQLVDRHEVLRTSFTTGADGEVLQDVHEHVYATIEVAQVGDTSDEAAHGILAGFVRPFDLGQAPLVRVGLAQGTDNSSLLVFDAHHIILDGTSMTLLVNEFSELFANAISSGQDNVPVPPEQVAFKDYTAWFAAQDMDAAAQYWTDEFAEPPAQLDLPTDFPRPALQTFAGATLTRTIPAQVRERVEELAHRTGATEAMVLTTAWGAVLARYGRTDDLVVGMPVSGRIHPDTETMLGMFVNTIPIRLHPRHDQPFADYLGQACDTIVTGLTHQAYPFEDILEHVTLPRDLSRNPLFDTALVYQNFAPATLDFTGPGTPTPGGTDRTPGKMTDLGSRFDLSVTVTPLPDSGYQVDMEYRTDLFTEDTIDYFFRHLETFLDHATDNPNTPVGDVPMIDADEMSVLDHINATTTALPDQHTIPDLFAHIVAAYPDKTAVVGDGQEWTYRDLDERARRIAARLREMGIRPDTLVGLYVGRGPVLIQAILGTLLSGGAYLGLDPAWPQARLDYVLGNARPALILTNGAATPPNTGIPTLDLGDPALYTGPAPVLEPVNQPGDAAYCIYTSGSTGQPKGVLVEHLGVVNLVNVAKECGVTSNDRLLQYASIAFDASVWEWAHALLMGGTLIVPTEAQVTDTAWLNARLAGDVTVMTAPPALIPQLDLSRLPRLISAGSQARPLPGFTGEYVNAYGPTEATVCSSLWARPDPDGPWPDPVPIGHPRANLAAYLVDGDGNLAGIGIPGELCVAGMGLARGYLGDPDLTARKFTPNPFSQGQGPSGFDRLYHTGDVAKWGPDGNLRFLGRTDDQVKIHGVRVEPGEIEHAIRDYPGITDAVVVARPDHTGDLALCAYYLSSTDEADADQLRTFAAERLPRSMVPSYWTRMDFFPVNQSGKIDVSALPDPDVRSAAYVEPSTPAEKAVADAMRDVLGLERVGAHDDFFALGGDSLKAMQLVNQIEERTGARLSLQDVFKNPGVASLASAMSGLAAAFEPISSAGGPGVYPASSPQRRLYVIDQLDPAGAAYHVPVMLRITGRMDPAVLSRVLQQLVDRHEVLRTSFTTGADGEVLQEVHEHADAAVEVIQVGDVSDEAAQEVFAGFVRPFHLGEAPLVRVMLAQGPDNESLLLFDAHHIILDGMSMTLLVNEFSRLYCGEDVPPVGVEYKDYAAWFSSQEMDVASQYWTSQFAEPPAQLDLPTDYPRPALQTFSGATLTRAIPASIREQVERLAHKTGATEAMILTAAWGAVLARYGRTDDLVVGMPVSGRIHPDTEHMLGMFVNTIPIRLHPRIDQPFTGYLDDVRDTMVTGLTHQAYPFEDILEHVTLPRDLSRNPLFDTVLVFQNFAPPELDLTGLDAQSVPSDNVGANLDVSVYVLPVPGAGYQVNMEYRTDLFTAETVDYFFRHLKTFLDHATNSPETPVGGIGMIDADEMNVLDELNDTASPVRDVTVVDLFDEQVASQPDATAVVSDGQEWTYHELDVRVSRIAARLHSLGVAPGQFVALLTTRSCEMVAALLGVLKTGAAYVPLNTDLPAARIEAMLGASHPTAVLTYGAALPDTVHPDCPVIDLSSPLPDGDLPKYRPSLDDPAYCLFTSGSTGVPKGVVITHRSLAAYAQEPALQTLYSRCDHPRFVATADYSFDISGTEFYAGMCRGMPILVATDTQCVDQHEFSQLVRNGGGTIIQATPTRLRMLTADPADRGYLAQVQLFLLGGEPVPEDLLDLLSQYSPASMRIVYGPTETTIYSTMGAWTPGQQVTIGRPLANEQAHLRDASGNLCGIGIPGELCLAGIGLARGYLGDPDLTAAKFVPNPFGEGRLYRTGDLTLWTPDGNLRFLGRIDTQVKVHGVRIETEEVEHAIRECPGIVDAVVIARPVRSGDTALCAYYTTDPDASPDIDTLRSFVGERLPRTMIPSYWTHMDALPTNRSGKTDKAALPDPEVHFADYAAPSTPTQCLVARIMSDVLGVDQIGLHDDFFALGGDSLKALQLVNQLQKHIGAQLRLQDVFQNPTLDALSDAVENQNGDYEPIVSAGGAGVYPTISQQREVLQGVNGLDGDAYHMSTATRIHGHLNPAKVQQVFQQLVDRHEALRTSFFLDADGQIEQEIHDHADAAVEVVHVEDTSDDAAKELMSGFVHAFDLNNPPLLRIELAEGPDDTSLVLVDTNHAILDGSSMTILIEEFSRLYRGEVLPPVGIEFKDYTAWLETQDLAPAEKFWSTLLEEPLPAVDMPYDHPRPPTLGFTDGIVFGEFSADLGAKIENLAHHTGTTAAMVVFAGLGAVFGRWTCSEDVILGMTVNGRSHPDTKDMLGMFAGGLPVRVRPRLDSTFEEYLGGVRDTMVSAMTYQSYPLQSIIKLVGPKIDPARFPFMDLIFTFQNFDQADIALPGIEFENIPSEDTGAKIDLAVFVVPDEEGADMVVLDYCSALYEHETMQAFYEDWVNLLDQVSTSPEIKLSEVQLSK